MIIDFPLSRALYRDTYKTIVCPVCKRNQQMLYEKHSKVWFPIAPFCCEVMRTVDTLEWNQLIDKLLESIC